MMLYNDRDMNQMSEMNKNNVNLNRRMIIEGGIRFGHMIRLHPSVKNARRLFNEIFSYKH